MELLDGIYTRRSVRKFKDEPVTREELMEIIRAGTWAPSGRNNQPWRFITVTEADTLTGMAGMTKYGVVIEHAPACIAVFVDKESIYDDVRDFQAIGACVQNMLLAAHALGLGAVWLGEILNRADEVRELLGASDALSLMAVVALGHPVSRDQVSSRKSIKDVLVREA